MDPDTNQGQSLTEQVAALHERLEELRAHESSAEPVLVNELSTAYEELRVAEEELSAQQQELDRLVQLHSQGRASREQLIARLPVPVFLTDAHGSIESANAAAGALLKTGLHLLVRKPLFAFVEPGERRSLRQQLARAVVGEDSELRARVPFLTRDGALDRCDVVATLQRSSHISGGAEVTWVVLGPADRESAPSQASAPELSRALVQLAGVPLEVSDPHDVAQRVTVLCQEGFSQEVTVSVTIGDPLTPETVASESQDAQAVDGAQLMAGEGPCIEAWRTAGVVSTHDMHTDDRWPRLRRYLTDVQLRSAIGAPLLGGDGPFGVVNVYAKDDHLADDDARQTAELLASTAATVLQEAFIQTELHTTAEQLRTALVSRATIDQAKGIVMARHACGPDEAFRILAKISSDNNVKLRELASRLVDETSGQ